MSKTNTNYLGEEFLDTSSQLYKRLNLTAQKVKHNIQTRSMPVSELVIKGRPGFRELMSTHGFVPNSLDNSYAKNDFQGLYIFSEKQKGIYCPVYIGISRAIMRRVLGHCNTPTKYYGTWAYMMAKEEYKAKHPGESKIPDRLISKLIQKKQEYLKTLHCTVFLIDKTEPAQHAFMHMLETYCASYFKAHWNSFKTH